MLIISIFYFSYNATPQARLQASPAGDCSAIFDFRHRIYDKSFLLDDENETADHRSLFARFLLVRRNKAVGIGDLQHVCALVMSVTKRVNIPFVVGTVGLLDVSANQVLLQTSIGRTIRNRLAAELLPMFQPRTASARGLGCSVDILDFHVSPFVLSSGCDIVSWQNN